MQEEMRRRGEQTSSMIFYREFIWFGIILFRALSRIAF